MVQAISQSGAGLSGASAVHMNIFGLHPVVVFGTPEQQARWLPPVIRGEHKACFGVTEPNTGLNTLKLKTKAVRDGDHYVVTGQKIWISTAQVAHKILLLARTTPIEELEHPTDGLTLFYTDLDRSRIEVREIDKLGRACVDSNQLFIDGLRIPVADRIGEEGKGFQLHPPRLQPRAHPDRGGGGGPRPCGARARGALRQRAHRVRPADRQEPGDPAPARAALDGARSREPDDPQGRLALRPRSSPARPRPTPPSTSPARPATAPARPRS